MATNDLDYTVGVNTTVAERNLANLQRSVGVLNDTFIRFKSTLATISLSALFQQALQLSDSLQDLSDATEISTNKILGFSSAVAANGGTMDSAQKGLARLVAEIDGAAESAGSSREAFKDVGVSLTDLRTKSSSQIFDQVIAGLAGIDDVAKRARLATELLGKEARNINFKNVSDDYIAASASALRYSDAIKSGADANDNIAKAIKTFQLEVIKLIQPITDFINNLKISTDAVSRFFDILGEAAKYAAYAVGFTLIGRAIYILGAAALAAISAITEITGGIIGLFRAMASAGTRSALMENLALLGEGIGPKVVVVLEAMGINTAFLAKHWLSLTAGISGAVGAMKEWIGFGKGEEGPKGRSYSVDDARRMQEYLDEQEKKIKRGQEAMAKFAGEVAKAKLESKLNLEVQGQTLSNLGFRLAHERSLIGLTEDQKELQSQLYDLDDQRFNKMSEYDRMVRKLEQERSLTKDEEANRLLGVRIKILKEEATESDAQALRHRKGIEDQIIALQSARMVEKARLQDNENLVKSIEDQAARMNTLADILRGINDKRIDLKFEESQKGKSPLERQIAQIQENARKASLEAGRRIAEGFGDTTDPLGMTEAAMNSLLTQTNLVTASIQALTDKEIAALGVTKEFANGQVEGIKAIQEQINSGLVTAWDEYKNKALDTAGQVKSSFENFTSGLEDAFVNFVKTGKLSFADLANSIIADLARIAVKKAIVGMASLFGFAAGGQVMSDTPIIVGERGPELFVPRTAGAIVPNNALGGMAAGSSRGEAQTNVTYNIQAVDAASFRSLVARDPSFIYAVTEQGRRSQPTRRFA